jgi:hypothetical protein
MCQHKVEAVLVAHIHRHETNKVVFLQQVAKRPVEALELWGEAQGAHVVRNGIRVGV